MTTLNQLCEEALVALGCKYHLRVPRIGTTQQSIYLVLEAGFEPGRNLNSVGV